MSASTAPNTHPTPSQPRPSKPNPILQFQQEIKAQNPNSISTAISQLSISPLPHQVLQDADNNETGDLKVSHGLDCL